MVKHGFFVLLSLLIGALTATPSRAQPADPLDLAAGAVVLSFTTQYDKGQWSALSLIDGTPKTGWSSAKGRAVPVTFVIELARTYTLDSLTIDNSTAQERKYPGISARGLTVHAATEGPNGPWTPVLTAEAAQGKRTTLPLPAGTRARWLKIDVTSNWGHGAYTEIMEIEATGTPVGPAPAARSVEGVYATNYNLMLVRQDGDQVTGCYDWDHGALNGTTDGRVIRFEWREDGPQIGTAIMVLSERGNVLNGLWYEGGALKGIWYGPRAKPGRRPKCSPPRQGALAQSLERTGEAIIYGIRFDLDSARVRPDSARTLGQILKLLQNRQDLRLTIEGHTDSTGAASYNRALSERRARAVVAWLTAHGTAAGRLQAVGMGESVPVADNATPQGRALNRRVALKTQ